MTTLAHASGEMTICKWSLTIPSNRAPLVATLRLQLARALRFCRHTWRVKFTLRSSTCTRSHQYAGCVSVPIWKTHFWGMRDNANIVSTQTKYSHVYSACAHFCACEFKRNAWTSERQLSRYTFGWWKCWVLVAITASLNCEIFVVRGTTIMLLHTRTTQRWTRGKLKRLVPV